MSTSPEATRARAQRDEAARIERIQVAFANPVFFGEHYMRPFDENWTAPLPKLAREMVGFAKSVRRGVLMTPPEFLKTTVVSQLYPLWLTCRYAVAGKLALLTGMLLSEEQELAERNLSVIAWHIEHNPRIAADFIDAAGEPLLVPDPEEDKWTDDVLIVRRPGVSKDPTWTAKGLKSKGIQGKRLRHLIGDDVVTPASGHSPAVQREAKRLWDEQVTTRVLEDGQALIAGNFNHPKDLLSELAARPSYTLMRRPALHVPGDPERPPKNPRDREAVVALPEKFSRLRLLQELADKGVRFDPIYLLRAGDAEGKLLREAWVTRITLEDVPRLGRVYLIGVDPAPGAEVDPDPSFFAYSVGILTPNHLDIIESFAARMEPTEQVEHLGTVVDKYRRLGHVGGISVAKIALDRYMKGSVMIGRPDLRPLLHEESIPGDKIERLSHLGSYFKSGWARITETAWAAQTAAERDRHQEETFGEQWNALPNQNHDDRLDATDVLIRMARGRLAGPVVAEPDPDRQASLTGHLLDRQM